MTGISHPGRRFLLGISLLALTVTVFFNIEAAHAQVLAESAAERFGGASSRPPLFKSMAQGQSPDSLFITCSDSRLIPNAITQTGIGELFVIRNAGNIVPPYDPRPEGVTATVEYAVAVLEVPTIIVCGHTLCGAMKGRVGAGRPRYRSERQRLDPVCRAREIGG